MGRTAKITAGLVIVALFLSAVPIVEAQGVLACAQTPSGASLSQKGSVTLTETEIAPITGDSRLTAKWDYKLEQTAYTLEQIPVTLSVKSDKGWANPVIASNTIYLSFDPNDQKRDAEVQADVVVTVAPDAPAFDRATITITAQAGDGTCVKSTPASEQNTEIKAGFYENWQARFQQTIWKTGQNERLQLPLIVDNHGNGPMRITFKIGEGTSSNLNFALPGPQTVESVRTGETNQLQIPIDVQTPFKNGYENRRDQLNLVIDGAYAYNTNIKTDSLELQAVIQTQGVYVPGFEAVTMTIALLGAAMLTLVRRPS